MRRAVSIIILPEDGGESRTFRLSRAMLTGATIAGGLLLLLLVGMVGSWFHLASRAARAADLAEQVAAHELERERFELFAEQLGELERRYEQIRQMFGADGDQVASDLWLPPPVPRSPGARPEVDIDGSLPTSWPLTQRGFVTQRLLAGDAGEHPGLDIAVPTGSYIRAAGAGVVVDVGDDPIYGLYVRLDHGDGYRSLYAHASETFVEVGQRVRRNEVIALSGSSGRSTAPHLHFEILLDGEAVDPLTMIRQPS
jgi:murein DD-endopeptidase MepM/ murein hydrolase activator NlpD